jgi:hypothetical protein
MVTASKTKPITRSWCRHGLCSWTQ